MLCLVHKFQYNIERGHVQEAYLDFTSVYMPQALRLSPLPKMRDVIKEHF
jgi:hypothetical protein